MTPAQLSIIQKTFGQVALEKDRVAAVFYERLFELDPSLRVLFKGDLVQQGAKLMSTIATAVGHLKQPEAIAPTVRALGQRHGALGVVDSHYDTVGQALLWTLERQLGGAFTPEAKVAWATMYGELATLMKDAARAGPATSSPATRG